MAAAAVADHVDDDVLVERLPEGKGQVRHADHRLGVISVHVEDRRLHHPCDVGGVDTRVTFPIITAANGGFNTGIYNTGTSLATVPISGKYYISTRIATSQQGANNTYYIAVNGVEAIRRLTGSSNLNPDDVFMQIKLNLLINDTVEVRVIPDVNQFMRGSIFRNVFFSMQLLGS